MRSRHSVGPPAGRPARAPLPLLLLLALLSATAPLAEACTSIIVGADATTDGSIFIARNNDGEDVTTAQQLVYHPSRSEPALFKCNVNDLVLELPAPGLAYTAFPVIQANPSKGRNASGESIGVNSAGVAISATESIYNSDAALTADPYMLDTGLVEDAIPSVLLPQATTARGGMETLGALVSAVGAGEGFGVLIADANESWYLETAAGHHWLAQRISEDSFFVTGNQGRFQVTNLSDTANVLASPGLEAFAVEAGLFDPEDGKPLNFTKAFMRDAPQDGNYSHPRLRKIQKLLGGKNEPRHWQDARMPVFMRPQHKLEVQDIMQALRDHFDGTKHDPYLHMNPKEPWRPVAVLRSGMGHVTRTRPPGTPDALSVIQYVAMTMPALSPFIPLYKGLPGDKLPEELTCATKRPDKVSFFWKARRLQSLVFQDWPALGPSAEAAIREFEADVESRQRPAMEERYVAAAAAGNDAEATSELVHFTRSVVRQADGLLVGLIKQAAADLGLPHVPPDQELIDSLKETYDAYNFEPVEALRRSALRLRLASLAAARSTATF